MSATRRTLGLAVRAAAAVVSTAAVLSLPSVPALAQDAKAGGGASAEEMAKKLQDPLANIKALMSDNDVLLKSGQDQTSYSFSLQPVYAVPFEDRGFNLVTRGIIPVLSMAPESQKPVLGEPLPSGSGRTFGLSDIALQFFFSPRNEDAWKWGVGPVVTLRSRTDSKLAGPGWGAGPAGVLVGNPSKETSVAVVAFHVWGEENGFSTSAMQPMVFYNFPADPSWEIAYNNVIAYDWNASSGNAWTIPMGLTLGKTFAFESGLGLNLGLGYYHNVEKPEGAADAMIRLNVNFLFP